LINCRIFTLSFAKNEEALALVVHLCDAFRLLNPTLQVVLTILLWEPFEDVISAERSSSISASLRFAAPGTTSSSLASSLSIIACFVLVFPAPIIFADFFFFFFDSRSRLRLRSPSYSSWPAGSRLKSSRL